MLCLKVQVFSCSLLLFASCSNSAHTFPQTESTRTNRLMEMGPRQVADTIKEELDSECPIPFIEQREVVILPEERYFDGRTFPVFAGKTSTKDVVPHNASAEQPALAKENLVAIGTESWNWDAVKEVYTVTVTLNEDNGPSAQEPTPTRPVWYEAGNKSVCSHKQRPKTFIRYVITELQPGLLAGRNFYSISWNCLPQAYRDSVDKDSPFCVHLYWRWEAKVGKYELTISPQDTERKMVFQPLIVKSLMLSYPHNPANGQFGPVIQR